MSFIFNKSKPSTVNTHGIFQPTHHRFGQKKETMTIAKLPNLVLHGITPNGTYFFCNLVYRKNLTERKKITLYYLIDTYANTRKHSERLKLKLKIKEACGDQIEGIALLFSHSTETFGFVTGTRVKVAQNIKNELLKLDSDELFSDLTNESFFKYHIFVLDNEVENASNIIKQYIQADQIDENLNTDFINAINTVNILKQPFQDTSKYLETASAQILDPQIKQQVNAVHEQINKLCYEDREIQFNSIVLTLQLLHSQDDIERKQLLKNYSNLASKLYGPKINISIIMGIYLCLFGAAFLVLTLLTGAAIPLSSIIITTIFCELAGLLGYILGKKEFYSEKAKQKRATANTFFNFITNFNNAPSGLIPQKIIDVD